VIMKNVICWNVTPCGSCKNRLFGGTYRLHREVTRIGELEATSALTSEANIDLSSPILVVLITEKIVSSETSVLIRDTLPKNSEDGILHSHCRENLKSYVALTGWSL
jgi:hypothetical protein